MRTWRKTNGRLLESTNEIEMIVEVWERYLHSHYHGNLVSECVSGEDFFPLGF